MIFFLNPFEIDIIQGEFSISNIIMIQKVSGELELIEMQEDQALQLKYKSTSITEFWKFVPESKYPELEKGCLSNYFNIRNNVLMWIILFHFKICEIQTPISIN